MLGLGDDEVIRLITQGGAIAVLGLAVLAFISERVVSGRTHRRVVHEKDVECTEWKRIALRSIDAADRAASGLEKGLTAAREPLRGASDQDLIGEMQARGLR